MATGSVGEIPGAREWAEADDAYQRATVARNTRIIQAWGDGYPVADIGSQFGLSRQRVYALVDRGDRSQ